MSASTSVPPPSPPPPPAPPVPSAPPPVDPAPSARSFLQTLEQTLSRLTTLRIVTVVGDVDVSGSGLGTVVAVRPGGPAEAASTDINLLDGQITNTFSPGFAALSGGSLQAFHQSQVEKSNSIMAANLMELQKLATALLSIRR